MHPVHHHLVVQDLAALRPTQAAVGMHEVQHKRQEWRALKKSERKALIESHWFPSVLGPGNRYFIVDHHHLGMALHLEGQPQVQVTVLRDLSWLDLDTFWRTMEFSQLAHPYGADGRRMAFSKLPKSIDQLKDDPYRSLAGLLRQQGGYAKVDVPFSEFLWADYLRQHFKKSEVQDLTKPVLAKALKLAKLASARYLPGWCGKV